VRLKEPAVWGEQAVETGHDLLRPFGVRLNNWMNHLCQEPQKDFVGPAREPKSRVVKDPVVFPVVIVEAVLTYIATCRREPRVRRRKFLEFVEAA